jgi:hypothetical protein
MGRTFIESKHRRDGRGRFASKTATIAVNRGRRRLLSKTIVTPRGVTAGLRRAVSDGKRADRGLPAKNPSRRLKPLGTGSTRRRGMVETSYKTVYKPVRMARRTAAKRRRRSR